LRSLESKNIGMDIGHLLLSILGNLRDGWNDLDVIILSVIYAEDKN
jgi:hypothetical protein